VFCFSFLVLLNDYKLKRWIKRKREMRIKESQETLAEFFPEIGNL